MRLSAIGDCIHALPTIGRLRSVLPEAHIGWAIQRTGASVLAKLNGADEYHLFPRREPGLERVRALRQFAAELRQRKYDIAIDLQGNSKSAFVARLAGARRIVGLPTADRRELNRWLVPAAEEQAPTAARHVIARNLNVLSQLGIQPSRPQPPSTWLAPALRSAERVRDVVICPGTTWESKIWPHDAFAELAVRLLERGLTVEIFWGGEAERGWATQIDRAVRDHLAVAGREESAACLAVAPELQLSELAGYLGRARLVVGNDSGPLHLAAALGVPSLAVFGPTDPARNGLYWPNTRSLHLSGERDVDCRPCWARTCSRGDLACLRRLGVQKVFDGCVDLLDAASRASSVDA